MIFKKQDHRDKPWYKWIVLSNTTLGMLMAGIDTSIVVISLPFILKSILLHIPGGSAAASTLAYQTATATSFAYLIWVLMGYMLIIATLLLFFGRLADMFGRVKIYKLGFAVFTVGSFFAGLSSIIIPNGWITEGLQLIIFRLLQGIGAAMMWSNTAAILTDVFPQKERGMALGTNMVAMVGGSVLGLVLGGIITSFYSWRWIFMINVPVGIIATVWAYMMLHEVSQIKPDQRLDISGTILLILTISTLLLAATFYTLGSMGAHASGAFKASFYPYLGYSYIAGIGFILLLAAFLINEIRFAKQPIIRFELFKHRLYSAGVLSSAFNAVGRGGVMFLLVFFLEGVKGFSALNAGLMLIPLSLGFLVVGPISGILSDRHGYRVLTTLGLTLSLASLLILIFLPETASYYLLLTVMLLAGIGGGLFASPNVSSIMSSVEPHQRGVGSAINSTLMNIAMMLSMTIAFVFIGSTVNISSFVTLFVGTTSNLPSSVVNSAAYQSKWLTFMSAFHNIFIIFAALVFVAVIISFTRPSGKGSQALY